jgi:hypothetical protein
MSDTEEVVIQRKPRNTKPEVAREKLKEKRIRLKKEKEDAIIEEAKKRLVSEEQNKKLEEQKKKELAEADPMTLMMRRMEDMMARMSQKPEPVAVKPKGRKKKVETVYAEEAKPVKVKAVRRKKVEMPVEDSPSNNFIGDSSNNIPDDTEYFQTQPEAQNVHPLLQAMASRRQMSSYYQ